MFTGQMGCEALNFILKRWIREERPKREFTPTEVERPSSKFNQRCMAKAMVCHPLMLSSWRSSRSR
jgi:hypothetical protein